ncbi:hypothetical protein ACFLWA_09980 [Chloroflexota bacterium]
MAPSVQELELCLIASERDVRDSLMERGMRLEMQFGSLACNLLR